MPDASKHTVTLNTKISKARLIPFQSLIYLLSKSLTPFDTWLTSNTVNCVLHTGEEWNEHSHSRVTSSEMTRR